MRVEAEPAFVLHERAYRESSVLLDVLSREHGRVGLVARGVRAEKPRFGRGVLKPFQPLLLGWVGRGELANVAAAEIAGEPRRYTGEALWSALYLNELLVRLLPRGDAVPELFDRYAVCLMEMATEPSLAWVLRRFERDLFTGLGYGLETAVDGEFGDPLQPDGDYSYDPERGAVAWSRRPLAPSIRGRSLLALGSDTTPDEPVLRDLRRLMRALVRHHLGGRELNAWRLFAPPPGV